MNTIIKNTDKICIKTSEELYIIPIKYLKTIKKFSSSINIEYYANDENFEDIEIEYFDCDEDILNRNFNKLCEIISSYITLYILDEK